MRGAFLGFMSSPKSFRITPSRDLGSVYSTLPVDVTSARVLAGKPRLDKRPARCAPWLYEKRGVCIVPPDVEASLGKPTLQGIAGKLSTLRLADVESWHKLEAYREPHVRSVVWGAKVVGLVVGFRYDAPGERLTVSMLARPSNLWTVAGSFRLVPVYSSALACADGPIFFDLLATFR